MDELQANSEEREREREDTARPAVSPMRHGNSTVSAQEDVQIQICYSRTVMLGKNIGSKILHTFRRRTSECAGGDSAAANQRRDDRIGVRRRKMKRA